MVNGKASNSGVKPRIRRFPISHFPFPITAALFSLLLGACAPGAPKLPTGAGVPYPGFASAYAQATEHCRVNTITAVMSMSGRVGGQRLRGRVDVGLAEPDRMVLEAVAPFGKPFFVLGASGGEATLVLPRDNRFLRGAKPEAIVEALTGVLLTPADLRAVLAGCGVPSDAPTGGRAFDDEWLAVDASGTTTWLRRTDGRWHVAAATRGSVAVHYADFMSNRPSTVRLRMIGTERAAADMTLRLSDVEVNTPLDAAVFKIEVPRDAAPLTLEELRRAGPLGRASQ